MDVNKLINEAAELSKKNKIMVKRSNSASNSRTTGNSIFGFFKSVFSSDEFVPNITRSSVLQPNSANASILRADGVINNLPEHQRINLYSRIINVLRDYEESDLENVEEGSAIEQDIIEVIKRFLEEELKYEIF